MYGAVSQKKERVGRKSPRSRPRCIRRSRPELTDKPSFNNCAMLKCIIDDLPTIALPDDNHIFMVHVEREQHANQPFFLK